MEHHTVLMGKNASQLTSALKEHLVSQRPHANNVRLDMKFLHARPVTNHPMALMEKPALPFPTAMMV